MAENSMAGRLVDGQRVVTLDEFNSEAKAFAEEVFANVDPATLTRTVYETDAAYKAMLIGHFVRNTSDLYIVKPNP